MILFQRTAAPLSAVKSCSYVLSLILGATVFGEAGSMPKPVGIDDMMQPTTNPMHLSDHVRVAAKCSDIPHAVRASVTA